MFSTPSPVSSGLVDASVEMTNFVLGLLFLIQMQTSSVEAPRMGNTSGVAGSVSVAGTAGV